MSRNAGSALRWRMVSRTAGSRPAARLSIDRTGVGARAGSCSNQWTGGVGGRVPRQLRGRTKCADAGDGVNAREQRWLAEHRARGGVGAAVNDQFWWWSTSCLFFNEGGSLSAPLHPPKRIAAGKGRPQQKQQKKSKQILRWNDGRCCRRRICTAVPVAVAVEWTVHGQQVCGLWREQSFNGQRGERDGLEIPSEPSRLLAKNRWNPPSAAAAQKRAHGRPAALKP